MIASIKSCVKGVGLGMSGSAGWGSWQWSQDAFADDEITHNALRCRSQSLSCGFLKMVAKASALDLGAT